MATLDDLLAEARNGAPKSGGLDVLLEEARKPKMGVAEDVAKSAGSGLVRGAAGLAATPVDVPAMAEYGVSYGLAKMAEKFGLLPKGKTAVDFVKSAQDAFGQPDLVAPKITGLINKNVIQLHEPETTAGSYVGSVAEMAPGIFAAGGGLLNKGAQTVGSGIGAEAAGDLAKGTGYETGARIVGGILAGGVSGRIGAPSVAERAVQRGMAGISPDQVDAAERLFNDARAMGVPLTRAEAVQAATNGATKLGDIQRVIEGQGELRGFMAQRPQQIETAGRSAFGGISAPPSNPSVVGPNVSKAADSVIVDANAARAAKTKPYYDAAKGDRVPEPSIDALISDIEAQVAGDKTGLSHGPLNELRGSLIAQEEKAGSPATRTPVTDPKTGAIIRYDMTPAVPGQPRQVVNDVENLDRVRKYFRDKTELPAFSPDAIDKETAARIGNITQRIDSEMETASPAFKRAKWIHQQETAANIDPLVSGPVGKLSDAGTTENAIGAAFPRNPLPQSENQLAGAIRSIGAKDPTAVQQLVRQHVESVFNNATKDLRAGANQFGGANFVSQLRGNPQQAKNLEAAIKALPNGDDKWNGLSKLLDVMEATGQRQRIGSQTAFNQELQAQLKAGKGTAEAFNLATTGGAKWPQFIRDKFQGWMLGKNTAEIANLLTDPSKDKIFRQLATSDPASGPFQKALGQLILISQSDSARQKKD